MNIKACCDCRYGSADRRCEHPQSIVELPDYYSGAYKTIAHSIDHMRTMGACDHNAKLFERRLDLAEG